MYPVYIFIPMITLINKSRLPSESDDFITTIKITKITRGLLWKLDLSSFLKQVE